MTTIYYELETHNRTVELYRGLIYAYYESPENEKLGLLKQQIAAHREALYQQIGNAKEGLLHSIPAVMEKLEAEITSLSDC